MNIHSTIMSNNKDDALSPEYAGPAFYNAPSASSLPMPKFAKHFSTVSGVSTQLTLGAQNPAPDVVKHIKQASSDSEKSSTERKSVSFTSDTKPNDGKGVILAIMEQDKSIDMVRGNSSRCPTILCLIYHIQNSKTTLMASAQRRAGFEKLAMRIREDNEAQAKFERAQHQASEIIELRQCQQAIIDHIEQKFTKVTIRYTLQEMFEIRDQKSTIPTNAQRQARSMQQVLMKQKKQEIWAENNHLLQLATQRLGQNLAKQQEILQQKLDEISSVIKQGGGNLANDELGLASSSDEGSLASTDYESTLVDGEIDWDEETEEEAEDWISEEMVDEQKDEGYYSMEEEEE